MKYRKQDQDGDYVFGRGAQLFVDTPEGVAQAIKTRLLLATGEWFLDEGAGTPYKESILGYNTQGSRDLAVKARVLETPGVSEILEYSSDVEDRKFKVSLRVQTIYSTTVLPTINVTF